MVTGAPERVQVDKGEIDATVDLTVDRAEGRADAGSGGGDMVVTVVGGNGQLGAACCSLLVARSVPCRASVRDARRGQRLAESGVDVVELDLTAGSDARRRALEGSECLILSVNAVAPRAGDSPQAVDRAMLDLVGSVRQR